MVTEVSVHDAGPALLLELILLRFGNLAEVAQAVGAFGRSKPVRHIRPIRIGIRHVGASPQRIYFPKNEVTAVADSLATDIAPKRGVTVHVSEEAILAAECDGMVGQPCGATEPCGSPVHRILV